MIYRFRHDKYNDFSVFEENKLAPRAYFIPFRSKKECDNVKYYEERYKSGMVRCLSGEWDFLYYKQVDDAVFVRNSGLIRAVERLKGHPRFGYVKLLKTERSETAAMADLLDE